MELEEVIIKASEISRYMELRAQGFMCRWSGEGKICMVRPKNWQELIKD